MTKLNPLVLIPGLKVVHLKTGNKYEVLGWAKNCTNAQDGQKMIFYKHEDDPHLFCREVGEFCEKFGLEDNYESK